MTKKINITLFTLALLVFFPTNYSIGQFIPNAPFKVASVYAPDFSLKDLRGKVFHLNNQRGRPVLIFFGTTWCPSCRNELPLYREIYETYTKRGLEVTYINIMEPQGKVAKFVKANALPFKILLDENGEVATGYNVVGVPTLVLIDKEGKIIKISHSTADLPLKKLFSVK
ncbi:MAG: peroxiredoxin family protein [Smithellaceae bacterium]